jgi:hypothetical protein
MNAGATPLPAGLEKAVDDTHPGLAGGPVYLDYNATTPVDPRVTAALPYWSDVAVRPGCWRLLQECLRKIECSISAVELECLPGRSPSASVPNQVSGFDVNEGMLTVARRIEPQIDWRHGDAANLPVAA